jgi:hypothetical protein
LHEENAEGWVQSFEAGLAEYDDINGKSHNFNQILYRNESDWEKG